MAGVVLLIMTQNLRVSIAATVAIIVIVYAETGVLVLLGWTLGELLPAQDEGLNR